VVTHREEDRLKKEELIRARRDLDNSKHEKTDSKVTFPPVVDGPCGKLRPTTVLHLWRLNCDTVASWHCGSLLDIVQSWLLLTCCVDASERSEDWGSVGLAPRLSAGPSLIVVDYGNCSCRRRRAQNHPPLPQHYRVL
jgi:hypothetical protein